MTQPGRWSWPNAAAASCSLNSLHSDLSSPQNHERLGAPSTSFSCSLQLCWRVWFGLVWFSGMEDQAQGMSCCLLSKCWTTGPHPRPSGNLLHQHKLSVYGTFLSAFGLPPKCHLLILVCSDNQPEVTAAPCPVSDLCQHAGFFTFSVSLILCSPMASQTLDSTWHVTRDYTFVK